MPQVSWEWKFGPASLLATAQFLVLVVGVGIVWGKADSEREAAHLTVTELKAIVSGLSAAQASANERVTKVETKVDLMLPAIQRIEARIETSRRQ